MSDERGGLPSASSAERYAQCPGSFLLEQQASEPPTSPDADTGNRIHAWLAGEAVDLSDDERELAVRCDQQALALIAEHGPAGDASIIREERIWAWDADTMTKAWSGKPDVVVVAWKRALVIDYKTGRGDVTESAANLQLRTLACLVADQHGVEEVVTAIVQPLAGEPTVCRYSPEDLRAAGIEVANLMHRVTRPGQPRNPSADACRYCRAKGICPEAQGVAKTMPQLVTRDGREITMTGEQIARFLELAPVAEDAIEAVRALAKRRLADDPTAVPGWALKPGATRETITDPEQLFARFSAIGGTSAQFIAAVKVGKSDFKAAVKAATGRKGRELDETLAGLLDGITEAKTAAPSLVQQKEAA